MLTVVVVVEVVISADMSMNNVVAVAVDDQLKGYIAMRLRLRLLLLNETMSVEVRLQLPGDRFRRREIDDLSNNDDNGCDSC